MSVSCVSDKPTVSSSIPSIREHLGPRSRDTTDSTRAFPTRSLPSRLDARGAELQPRIRHHAVFHPQGPIVLFETEPSPERLTLPNLASEKGKAAGRRTAVFPRIQTDITTAETDHDDRVSNRPYLRARAGDNV